MSENATTTNPPEGDKPGNAGTGADAKRPAARGKGRVPTPGFIAAASPGEIELGGKTYRMSPLTDRDLGELERWLQDGPMKIARRNLEGLSPELQAVVVKEATAIAAGTTLTSDRGLRLLSTLDGASRAVWLGLRHNHPDLTPEAVREMLLNDESIAAAMEAVNDLNDPGPMADDGPEGGAGKKKAGRAAVMRAAAGAAASLKP